MIHKDHNPNLKLLDWKWCPFMYVRPCLSSLHRVWQTPRCTLNCLMWKEGWLENVYWILEKIWCGRKCDHRWEKLLNPSSLLRTLADDLKTMSRNQDSLAQCLNQIMPKRFRGLFFCSEVQILWDLIEAIFGLCTETCFCCWSL